MSQIDAEINTRSLSWTFHIFKAVLFCSLWRTTVPSCKQYTQKKSIYSIFIEKYTTCIKCPCALKENMKFNPYSAANFEVVAGGEQIPSMGTKFLAQCCPSKVKCKSWCLAVSVSCHIFQNDCWNRRGEVYKCEKAGKYVVQVVGEAAVLKHYFFFAWKISSFFSLVIESGKSS